MKNEPDRLVRRLLQRASDEDSPSSALGATPRERAELEARIRRLRMLGNTYQHITLSASVGSTDRRGTRVRDGGVCVATEV